MGAVSERCKVDCNDGDLPLWAVPRRPRRTTTMRLRVSRADRLARVRVEQWRTSMARHACSSDDEVEVVARFAPGGRSWREVFGVVQDRGLCEDD